jgi:hypothetical protein
MGSPCLLFWLAVSFLALLMAIFACIVRFETALVMIMKIAALWDVTPRSLLEVHRFTEMSAHF